MGEEKGSEQKIQWHQGFVGAMHCELLEDIDKLRSCSKITFNIACLFLR